VLKGPTAAITAPQWADPEGAAQSLAIRLHPLKVQGANDLQPAFSAASRERVQAVIVFRNFLFESHRERVIQLATEARLPTMFEQRDFVEGGGLMSYGPSLADIYRRAATYVDRILKGAKPADLPVEQPTKFELVINLKTAKALGLRIPPSVLARADEVIQ